MTTLGNRIRERRKSMGWTQKHLAELTGLGQSNISEYENDLHIPSHEAAKTLARHLGMSLDDLTGDVTLLSEEAQVAATIVERLPEDMRRIAIVQLRALEVRN